MELRDYIEEGIEISGTAAALGKLLNQPASVISNAKAHQRGLPLAACYKLADLIGAQHDAVAAASALVTEKDESVINYLRPFAQAVRHAQHLTIAIIAGTTAFMLVAENSYSTFGGFLL